MYISDNLKKEIKEKVDIVALAKEYFNVKRIQGKYTIDSENGQFDSIIFYPNTNTFYRWSNGSGGDVIKFVMETNIEGITKYQEAIAFLSKKIDRNFSIKNSGEIHKEKELSIEERHKRLIADIHPDNNNRNIMAYLIKERGVSSNIVYKALERGYIKQTLGANNIRNIAFIGRNRYGAISNLCYRGINKQSSFKSEDDNSDRKWAWVWEGPDKSKDEKLSMDAKVIVFEGYIDMLSYLSMQQERGEAINKDIYVSLGSATKYKAAVNIAEAYGLKKMVIALDNDPAGERYASKLKELFESKNENNSTVREKSDLKDWNEDLKKAKNILPKKSISSRINDTKSNMSFDEPEIKQNNLKR